MISMLSAIPLTQFSQAEILAHPTLSKELCGICLTTPAESEQSWVAHPHVKNPKVLIHPMHKLCLYEWIKTSRSSTCPYKDAQFDLHTLWTRKQNLGWYLLKNSHLAGKAAYQLQLWIGTEALVSMVHVALLTNEISYRLFKDNKLSLASAILTEALNVFTLVTAINITQKMTKERVSMKKMLPVWVIHALAFFALSSTVPSVIPSSLKNNLTETLACANAALLTLRSVSLVSIRSARKVKFYTDRI